jgi:hypothetical protein
MLIALKNNPIKNEPFKGPPDLVCLPSAKGFRYQLLQVRAGQCQK